MAQVGGHARALASGSIPGQGPGPGCGLDPQRVCVWVSLASVFLSQINKNNIFLKKKVPSHPFCHVGPFRGEGRTGSRSGGPSWCLGYGGRGPRPLGLVWFGFGEPLGWSMGLFVCADRGAGLVERLKRKRPHFVLTGGYFLSIFQGVGGGETQRSVASPHTWARWERARLPGACP